jgi:hypothetical protein
VRRNLEDAGGFCCDEAPEDISAIQSLAEKHFGTSSISLENNEIYQSAEMEIAPDFLWNTDDTDKADFCGYLQLFRGNPLYLCHLRSIGHALRTRNLDFVP